MKDEQSIFHRGSTTNYENQRDAKRLVNNTNCTSRKRQKGCYNYRDMKVPIKLFVKKYRANNIRILDKYQIQLKLFRLTHILQ